MALVYPVTGDYIYQFVGSGDFTFKYSISGNNWTRVADAPINKFADGVTATYPGTGDFIYVTGGAAGSNFYKYSISGNSYSSLATAPAAFANGSSLVSTGNDYIYALRAGNSTAFYRYSISGNSWSTMTSISTSMTNGAIVYPGTGDYIYASPGSTSLYRYSISGNSWTQMTSANNSFGAGSNFSYPGSGNYFYANSGSDGAGAFSRYAIGNTYASSGTLTSSAIDLGQASNMSTLTWNGSTPANTTLKFQIRAATSSGGLSSATYYGPTGTGDYYTSSGTAINATTSGYRYYQYKAYLDTTDTTVTPTLSDVTLNYSYYPSSSTLTSSAFNSGDSHNVLAKIQWTATTPTNTAVKFQLRSAPNSSGVPGTYTSFMGPDGTSGSFFTDSTGSQTFPSALTDGSSDQWFQYKAFLTTSDNLSAPTLSDVTTTYVVNAPPDFDPDYPSTGNGGVGAVENADGTVTINYSVRDTDTATGTTPNTILPTFEYSLNNGSSWATIISGNLAAGDLSAQSVGPSSYTTHSATWNAAGNVPGTYASQVKIRVTANDSEAANNTASATSLAFALDTKAPALGLVPVSIDESQSPAVVTLSATDDSAFQMRVGKVSNLSDASYETYSGTKTFTMSPSENIYAQFMDAYGNTSAIVSALPPSTPSNMFFQDVSNPELLDWRIFFAWSVISEPSAGFKRYNIYRSTDGGGYSLLTTISSRAQNYYVDAGLVTTSNYSYKVTAEDNNGNISFFSPSISHTPNGVGGSDITPPTLSSVAEDNETTSGATITWETDKLSDSTVYYVASSTYPGPDKTSYTSSIGVPSMVTSHSVTLSGLNSGTKYYFLVESTDASNNIGNSSDSSYTFDTTDGPSISNVTVPSIFDGEATISWKTDIASDSQVTYSVNSDMSAPTNTEGSGTLVTDHSVTLTGLTSGTKYYYYVSSTDGSDDMAVDKNVIDGEITYYNFVTTVDTSLPIISNVATSLVGENGVAISWTTDKPSLSQVEWGETADLGTSSDETNTFTFDHSIVLTGLSDTKQYFYKVISKDKNDNSAESAVYNFTTLAPTIVTETVTVTETIRVGGGGSGNARDTTPPTVSDIKVSSITSHSAVITFTTSKIANGVASFGTVKPYTGIAGDTDTYSLTHRIVLVGLNSGTLYHFIIKSNDVYNDEGVSTDTTFTTLIGNGTDILNDVIGNTVLSADEQSIIEKVKLASPSFVEQLLISLSQNSNLVNVPDDQLAKFVSDFAAQVGASPSISGPDIIVETGPHSALIRWTTDKESNSLISYAKSEDYKPGTANPYTISAGFPDDSVTAHSVTLPNLEANTIYHFNARSQGTIGSVSESGDKTFQTTSLFPQINNLHFDTINENSSSLSWVTDVPTRSDILITDTRTGEQQKISDSSYIKDHTSLISKLNIATSYTVALTATDSDGNVSKSSVLPFTTVLSKEAPKIYGVHISTSLIPDQSQLAQTIISWKTDKPATSKVLFAEGSVTNLSQSTTTEPSLVLDHIVVTTKLKPGTAYTLKVESGDSAGNITDSGRYSILTPKLAGSVVDLIFGNFNKTFGFLKN
ncbi:fibronectin type III domain-containing protein [Patescibacteria group bacterium]|nr:fibronectin type III domain-containing protein [Patescibacteria group bacterium]